MNKFTQTPNSVMDDNSISHSAKLVYGAILRFAWNTKKVFPGQVRLAEMTSLSESSVKRCLIELREKKLISWKRRGFNKTNIYTLCDLGDDSPSNGLPAPVVTAANPQPVEPVVTAAKPQPVAPDTTEKQDLFCSEALRRQNFVSHDELSKLLEEFEVNRFGFARSFDKFDAYYRSRNTVQTLPSLRSWLGRERWELDDFSTEKYNIEQRAAILKAWADV